MTDEANKTGMNISDWYRNEHSLCPVCGSANVSYDFTNYDGSTVTQNGTCFDCHSRWYDDYRYCTSHITSDGRYEHEER